MGSTTYTNSITYAYALPTVTDVQPRKFLTDGGTLMTITGTNLGIDIANEIDNRAYEGYAVQNYTALRPNQVFFVYNSLSLECVVQQVNPRLLGMHRTWS